MVVNLDLGLLLRASLNPNQFVYCYLLFKKSSEIVYIPEEDELAYLEKLKYIIKGVSTGHVIVTTKFTDLLKVKLEESGFERLYNTYPHKVPNGSGYRILRPISLESKIAIECKEKYTQLITSRPFLEEKIYQALLVQLEVEKASLPYLHEFSRWLKNSIYEKYFDVDTGGLENVSSPTSI